VAAIMLLVTKIAVDEVPKTATLRAGVVAVIGIFGLAWLGDSFIAANKDVIVPAIGQQADAHPWTFALGLFFASVLLYSQAATTRALMPLGMALGIPPQFLIAMFPSVNGYFFIPTYGSLIAAINFDLAGTTKIGNRPEPPLIPGLVATSARSDGPCHRKGALLMFRPESQLGSPSHPFREKGGLGRWSARTGSTSNGVTMKSGRFAIRVSLACLHFGRTGLQGGEGAKPAAAAAPRPSPGMHRESIPCAGCHGRT
jgi:hypothetical protein